MRTETPTFEKQPTPEELENKTAEIMYEFFNKRLEQLAGKREIPNFKELNLYWTCIALDAEKLKNIGPDLVQTANRDTLKNLFLKKDYIGAPVDSYNKIAGQNLAAIIEQFLQQDTGAVHIADLGCGSGTFLDEMKNMYRDDVECFGVDPFDSNVPDTVNFGLGLAEVLPEDWDEKFDMITCFEASMYFLDKQRALQEALRAVKPGGKIFYGTGANNIAKNFNKNLFEKLLAAQKGFSSQKEVSEKYTYEMPKIFVKEKEYERTFRGSDAFYTQYYFPYLQYLESIDKERTALTLDTREFTVQRHDTPDMWCPETLQIERIK